jgi:tRNA-specific 2-thiouridylase
VLGDEEDLLKKEMLVGKLNFIKYEGIQDGMEATIRIRYKDFGNNGTLHTKTDGVGVNFYDFAKGIAPGQSAVFYEGDDVIGGGIIQRTIQ